MTLRDAIIHVDREYGIEVRKIKSEPQYGDHCRQIIEAEFEQIGATRIVETLLSGRTFFPPEVAKYVEQTVLMALRFGMRVQRKLDHPDRPTSILDSPCTRGTGERTN